MPAARAPQIHGASGDGRPALPPPALPPAVSHCPAYRPRSTTPIRPFSRFIGSLRGHRVPHPARPDSRAIRPKLRLSQPLRPVSRFIGSLREHRIWHSATGSQAMEPKPRPSSSRPPAHLTVHRVAARLAHGAVPGTVQGAPRPKPCRKRDVLLARDPAGSTPTTNPGGTLQGRHRQQHRLLHRVAAHFARCALPTGARPGRHNAHLADPGGTSRVPHSLRRRLLHRVAAQNQHFAPRRPDLAHRARQHTPFGRHFLIRVQRRSSSAEISSLPA